MATDALRNSIRFWFKTVCDTARTVWRSRLWLDVPHTFPETVRVPENFFGVNVATSADPACDDYIITRLHDLGIRHVRLQFCDQSWEAPAGRLLQRLLDESFHVLLNLVQSVAEAGGLPRDTATQRRWRSFVERVFTTFGARIDLYEIGAAPNRKRWSGYRLRGYLKAWEIACAAASGLEVKLKLAGPNISDFEPLHNVAFLHGMKRAGVPPHAHTDNLFVERVIEPEALDRRVGGRWLSRSLSLNLVKKAGVLADISERLDSVETYCAYTCWKTRRLIRLSGCPEEKKADYLTRYLIIAAASGHLQRVYWGPLIGYWDGLIDDGTERYPPMERVTRYDLIHGLPGRYRPEPAFYALGHIVKSLQGSRLLKGICADNGINYFEFSQPDDWILAAVWTRDRYMLPLTQLVPHPLPQEARVTDRQGHAVEDRSLTVCESPLFVILDKTSSGRLPTLERIKAIPPLKRNRTVFTPLKGIRFFAYRSASWQGAFACGAAEKMEERCAALLPERLHPETHDRVLRDKRNRVWSRTDPLMKERTLVVKQIRVRGLKRVSYLFRTGKARRNWNHASEMLRRGVDTPMPIAFWEQSRWASVRESFYICMYAGETWSCRQAFNAFREGGHATFQGFTKEKVLDAVVGYIWNMHWHKILHRDLSAGNLLLKANGSSTLKPLAIDIGRVKVSEKTLTTRQRLLDLIRICHPLDGANRTLLLDRYFALYEKQCRAWHRVPFRYYDWKHRIKGWLKPLKKR